MNGWRLFQWVLLRGIVSGTLLGAAFLYVGIFWGAVLGAVFGIVNGITLVLLTYICFTPLVNQHHYRWSVLLVSIATTIGVSLLWASGIDASPEVALILTIVASFTVAVFAWCLSNTISSVDEVRRPLTNAVLFYIKK